MKIETINTFWDKISNIGLSSSTPKSSYFYRRTRLINQSNAAFVIIIGITGIALLFFGGVLNALLTFALGIVASFNIIAHHFKKFNFVSTTTILTFLSIQLYLATCFGEQSYAEFCIIILPTFSFLFFNNTKIIALSFVISIVGYFTCIHIYNTFPPLFTADIVLPNSFIPAVNLSVINAFIMAFYKKELMMALGKLEQQNQKILRISQEIELKHSELEVISNIIPACIGYVDKDLIYLFNNKNYENWFGTTLDSLKGKPISDRMSPHQFKEEKKRFDYVFKTKKTLVYEQLNNQFANPNIKHIRVSLIPDIDTNSNEVKGVYIFAEDITAIKTSSLALSKVNQELTKEIELRIQTEQQLIEVNAEMQQFSSIASHDLKEPIRTISGFAKLIRRNKNLPANNIEYLDFIDSASLRMTQLINDLIAYSKIDKTTYKFQLVDLNTIIHAVKLNLHHKIETNKAEIIHGDLPQVWGMNTPLIQLFQNIISNAIKFQKPDVIPKIEISTSIENNYHYLTIADNGIGMDKEYFEKIFSPFTRLHTRDNYEGSGLGLATCKKIVQQLGGEISVSSELDKGTTFHIRLPYQLPQVGSKEATSTQLYLPVN